MKICLKCGNRFERPEWECPACNFAPTNKGGFLSFAPEQSNGGDGFKEEYFAELESVENNNFWFRSRNELIIYALKRFFPEAKTMMEIGCGTGFVLSGIKKALPEISVTGSELFSAGLGFAATRLPKADLFQMDARKIPFEQAFDVIGAFDLIEHIEEDEVVLSRIHNALRPGGGLILTVPQHPFLWSDFDRIACHVRRYRASELKAKVERAGFRVVKTTSFMYLLFPLMLAMRLKPVPDPEKYDVMKPMRLSHGINNIFEMLLGFERALIRMGVAPPFGGSLLLVAEKN
ncbi:MAG TPA: class I SAM-dependent methyltransferase [bacterium]|nr:class I SAM-dependent methyltransferase [bacterium]